MAGRYATNAAWPEPNQWTWQIKQDVTRRRFRAGNAEILAAHEKGQQRALRNMTKRMKAELYQAIIHKDLRACRKLLCNSLLLEAHTPYGATPLILAAAVGDAAIVTHLLELGANIVAQDSVGASPLISAAFKGHLEILQLLLNSKQGGNAGQEYLLRQCTRRGESAVLAAAKMGHLDCLKMLLERGSDCMTSDCDGADALALAASLDRTEVIKLLVSQCRLSADRLDHLGRTPLMRAAAGAAYQAVKTLLALEPQVERDTRDAKGYTALHHACVGGDIHTVEALAAVGLVLDPYHPEGEGLLTLACSAGHVNIVKWLLQRNIGTASLLTNGSNNPIFCAVRSQRLGVVDVLLEAGARIDVRDARSCTPLAWAAKHGHTALARQLVERGASLLVTDANGHVPRQLAQLGHHRATSRLLSVQACCQLVTEDDSVGTVTQRHPCS